MFDKIYKKIEQADNIVIVRHIGVDPDALASQLALRDTIKMTFPNKKVMAWGNSSIRFDYFPKLDRLENVSDVLLIVVDTPDKKRVDFTWNISISDSIKIDHHPFIEEFCNLEYIDDYASSASELVLQLINNTPLILTKEIAEVLFMGIASDTNRFLFNPSSNVFRLVSDLLAQFDIDVSKLYYNLYKRPLSEVRFQGYIAENMIVTEHGLGYIKISNETLNEFGVDVGSAGNMVNDFNSIDEVITWVIISEDVKNNLLKANIRSRGPIINSVAEKYNGGGHRLASGARMHSMDEVDRLIADLDEACNCYNKEMSGLRNEN